MSVRHRLKLKKIDFISCVDRPAQETAEVVLIKRVDGEGRLAENLAYLDGLAARDPEYAIEVAKRNASSWPGNWGQAWLDSRCDLVDDSIEKAVIDAVDIEAAYQSALAAYNNGLAAYMAANPGMQVEHFLTTDEGRRLLKAHTRAHEDRVDPHRVAARTMGLDGELARIDAQLAARVESFSLAHNLEADIARTRLEEVSPSYVKLLEERQALYAKVDAFARELAVRRSMQALAAVQAAANKARSEALQKRADSMLPAEKALHEHVAKIAADKKLAFDSAMGWAMEHDATTRALYGVYREEFERRAAHGGN